ncbi:hypothetical protein ACR6HW_01330 [Fusibacter sp. JL298sf-3]
MTDSEKFIDALKSKDLKALQTVPKADLHNHAGLGMRFETFEQWVGHPLPPPPKKMAGIAEMDAYMATTAKYVASREGFEFLLEATLAHAVTDGVTVIEPSIDCGWLSYYSEAPEAFFSYIQKCKRRFQDRLTFKPEVGVFKGFSENMVAHFLWPCLDSGVFESIDFYGEERYYQPALTQRCLLRAKALGLKTKIHIGEFSDAETTLAVYDFLKPDVLQHGIALHADPKGMARLKADGVRLNLCPTSNVVLGAVASIENHPIRKLFDAGLKVTVNTDDLLFFHKSVSEEFLQLYEAGCLTAEELDVIRRYGLE